MGAPNDGDKSWFDEPRNINIWEHVFLEMSIGFYMDVKSDSPLIRQ